MIHLLTSIAVLTIGVVVAKAQCVGEWLFGAGELPTDPPIVVEAVTAWDPDGAGPTPSVVVAGGTFASMGYARANNIAYWDGTTWNALGAGLDGTVRAILVFDGQLIVGGDFRSSDGRSISHLARWDGLAWQEFASGASAAVRALRVFNNELIAGGLFTNIGGVNANRVARWNGTAWSAYSDGVPGPVYAIHDFQGQLVIGGSFLRLETNPLRFVATWNGTAWQSPGTGTTSTVYCFATWAGQLVAGGVFRGAGNINAARVASWNGTNWQAIGTGMNAPVRALIVRGTTLIAGGEFTRAGSMTASYVAAYSGSSDWYALTGSPTGSVQSFALLSSELVAGGVFTSLDNLRVQGAARWDGTTWRPLGSGALSISSLGTVGTRLYAGGNFSSSRTGVARWTDAAFESLGENSNDAVNAVHEFRGELIAGGRFTLIGNATFNHIARWDGTAWNTLAQGTLPSTIASPGTVFALATFRDALFATGPIANASGVRVNGIARWNGESWSNLVGGGLGGTGYAMLVRNDRLIVGGQYDRVGADSLQCGNVASWDGSTWEAFVTPSGATGVNGLVRAIAIFRGDLVVAGRFSRAGDVDAINIARWDGTTWHALGAGLAGLGTSTVFTLDVYRDRLVAGGSFSMSGTTPLPGAALWDGTSWSIIDLIGAGGVRTLQTLGQELYLGGSLTSAGDTPSLGFARWRCHCLADVDNGTFTGTPDGGVTVDDLLYYLIIYSDGVAHADIDDGSATGTPDGGVTIDDLLYFLARFEAGC